MQDLLCWAKSQGGKFPKLRISESNQREYIATNGVDGKEVLISLPQSLLMHHGQAIKCSEFGVAFQTLLQHEVSLVHDKRHILCMLLILERCKGSLSHWAPYIDILPETYDDPYWWTLTERQLVTGTRLEKAIEDYLPGLQQLASWMTMLEEQYRSLNPTASLTPLSKYRDGWAFTVEAARWARSTVWSRSFTVHRLEGCMAAAEPSPYSCSRTALLHQGPAVALIPVLDMIDHNPDVEVVWHTGPEGRDDFHFCPVTPFSKGAVLKNNYGNKTNDEFILAYGFAIRDNPADYFQVSIAQSRWLVTYTSGSSTNTGAAARGPDKLVLGGRVEDVESSPPAVTQRRSSGGASDSGQGGLAERSSTPSSSTGGMAAASRAAMLNGTTTTVTNAHTHPSEADGIQSSTDLQQEAVEALQREVAMMELGLKNDHRLTVVDPLPPALLRSVRLCLMPTQDLYTLYAHLLDLTAVAGTSVEEVGSRVRSAGSTRLLEGPTVVIDSCRPHAVQEAGHSILRNGGALPESAMHVAPKTVHQCEEEGGVVISLMATTTHLHDVVNSLLFRGHVSSSARECTSAGSLIQPPIYLQGSKADTMQSFKGSEADVMQASKEMQVLSSLQRQLESKLHAMVSEQKARRLLSLPVDGVPLFASSLEAKADPVPHLNYHAELALTYVQSQRNILLRAIQAVRGNMGRCLMTLHDYVCPGLRGAPGRIHGSGVTGCQDEPASAVFDVLPSAKECNVGTERADVVPTAFVSSTQQHMVLYWSWWIAQVAKPGSELDGNECRSSISSERETSLSLREVICCPRKEVVAAVAAGSTASTSSGSKGKRRPPVASVTLRVIRNHAEGRGGGEALPRASSVSAAHGGSADGRRHTPSLPAGVSAALGLDLDLEHDPVSWGAETLVSLNAGDVMLEVRAEHAIKASSKQELITALMIPAHALLQDLVVHASMLQGQGLHHSNGSAIKEAATSASHHEALDHPDATGSWPHSSPDHLNHNPHAPHAQRRLSPQDMLVLHLMHMVSAPPAARLPASESDHAAMLLEMLEDSPAGSAYQEAFDAFKADLGQIRAANHLHLKSQRAMQKTSCEGHSGYSMPHSHMSPPRKGSTTTTSGSAGLTHTGGSTGGCSKAGAALGKVLAWPGALGLYCWASAVVDRAAVQYTVTATDAHTAEPRSSRLAAGHGGWAILPGVAAVPPKLREAVVRVELTDAAALSGHVQPACPTFVVLAACALPKGVLLAPPLLLSESPVDLLMDEYGPEAVTWRRLIKGQHTGHAMQKVAGSDLLECLGSSSPEQPKEVKELYLPTDARPQPRTSSSPTSPSVPSAHPSNALLQLNESSLPATKSPKGGKRKPGSTDTLPNFPGAQYELYISPSEEDALMKEKMNLLTASGLGSVHYLTMGKETEPLVTSALKICLCDEELLSHSLAMQVVKMYRTLQVMRSEGGRPETLDTLMNTGGESVKGVKAMTTGGESVKASMSYNKELQEPEGSRLLVGRRSLEACGEKGLGVPSDNDGHFRGAADKQLLILRQSQRLLIEMLEGLPNDHAVSVAASKQLRHIISDARKHAKRRLRQMDTHLQRSCGGFWGSSGSVKKDQESGNSQGVNTPSDRSGASTLGGEILRQGVHLYLEELSSVLDVWADHLGIESKLEPSRKRHKVMHLV